MNALTELARDPSVQQLGWTLLHFIWQGSVVGAAFAVVECSLRKNSADLRYLSGCFALGLVLLISSMQVWRVRRLGNEPIGEPYLQALKRLQQILSIDRSISLLKSALVEVPTLIGWLRPVILFPAGSLIGLAPAQVEAILAHELAHVRRYDYLINLLQNIVETLLFYHSAVWWISHRVRIEREQCCDDLAVKVCGDRLGYAKALAALEELRSAPVALALRADGGSLLTRIRRFYREPTNSRPSNWQKAGGILAVAAVLAMRSTQQP